MTDMPLGDQKASLKKMKCKKNEKPVEKLRGMGDRRGDWRRRIADL